MRARDRTDTTAAAPTRVTSRRHAWFAALIGLAVLDLALIAPNHPDALTLEALRMIPLELPAVLLALLLPWRAGRRWAAGLVAGGLGLMLLVKAGDLGSQLVFGLRFNPLLDWHRLPHALDFFRPTVGTIPLATAVASAVGLAAVVLWGVWRAARAVAALPDRVGGRAAVLLAGVVIVVGGAEAVRRLTGLDTHSAAFTTRVALEHVHRARAAARDLRAFRPKLTRDPLGERAGEDAFRRLAGRDVLVVFAESYGRTVFERPRYRERVAPELARLAEAAAAKGMGVRSGWLTSPTVGGQTWLAHATFTSGAWIDRQHRYGALLRSDRASLSHLFGRAGWHTAAVMPSNRPPWPGAAYFAHDTLLNAPALDYRGRAFNWVTMPDQYTLEMLSRRLLRGHDRPVYAEAALISSHAPWTPIPDPVPWDAIEHGHLFNAAARRGPDPAELWRNPDRVRAKYAEAVAYVLHTLGGFVQKRLPRDAVLMIVGDHQPAPLVTGANATRHVPAHLIAPTDVLAATEAWGWTEGVIPAPDAPVWRMDRVRGCLLRAFGPAGERGPNVVLRRPSAGDAAVRR